MGKPGYGMVFYAAHRLGPLFAGQADGVLVQAKITTHFLQHGQHRGQIVGHHAVKRNLSPGNGGGAQIGRGGDPVRDDAMNRSVQRGHASDAHRGVGLDPDIAAAGVYVVAQVGDLRFTAAL